MLRQEHEPEERSEPRTVQQQMPSQDTPSQATGSLRTGRQSVEKQWADSVGERTIRRFRIVLVLCILSFLLGIPAMLFLWQMFPLQPVLAMQIGTLMIFGGLLGLPATLMVMVVKNARAANRKPMPVEQGVRAIGPLLDRMTTDVLRIPELRERLTRLLPRLQPEDAAVLESRHYEFLNAYLHRQAWGSHAWQRGEKAYLLAVLDAYARIGDGRALPDVARIAKGKVAYVLRDEEVRAAAQRCLPHLEQAAEALRQKETLLRTSEAPSAQDILLQPAAFATEPDPNHLLRPADTDENAS